jgi:hypothetical protein
MCLRPATTVPNLHAVSQNNCERAFPSRLIQSCRSQAAEALQRPTVQSVTPEMDDPLSAQPQPNFIPHTLCSREWANASMRMNTCGVFMSAGASSEHGDCSELSRPLQRMDMRAHNTMYTSSTSHNAESIAVGGQDTVTNGQLSKGKQRISSGRQDGKRQTDGANLVGAAARPGWSHALMSAHTLLSAGGHSFKVGATAQAPSEARNSPQKRVPDAQQASMAALNRQDGSASAMHHTEFLNRVPRLRKHHQEGAEGTAGQRDRRTLSKEDREDIALHEKLMQCRQVLSASKVCHVQDYLHLLQHKLSSTVLRGDVQQLFLALQYVKHMGL